MGKLYENRFIFVTSPGAKVAPSDDQRVDEHQTLHQRCSSLGLSNCIGVPILTLLRRFLSGGGREYTQIWLFWTFPTYSVRTEVKSLTRRTQGEAETCDFF